MARLAEVIGFLTTLPNVLVFMFAYLFPCKITTIVCVEILGNKKMLALVECLDSYFLKYQQLYQQEVFPKIVFQIF
jgi:type IV secretory pathway component VirB8